MRNDWLCRAALNVAGLLAVVVLPGCGSGSPMSPSSPPPRTPAPVTTLLREGSFANLPSNYTEWIGFTTNTEGQLTVDVDWTFASDQVDVAVASGDHTCVNSAGQTDFDVCNVVSFVTDASKPKKLSLSSLAAGSYTLYVGNLGSRTEACSYQIFLTTPG